MTKKEIEEVLLLYKDQIQSLKEQVQTLREEKLKLQEQNFSLQEGILSIKAPDAYRDLQMDRYFEPETDERIQEKRRFRALAEIQEQYMHNLERPLFSDPEDMTMMLSEALNSGDTLDSKSVHNNSES